MCKTHPEIAVEIRAKNITLEMIGTATVAEGVNIAEGDSDADDIRDLDGGPGRLQTGNSFLRPLQKQHLCQREIPFAR